MADKTTTYTGMTPMDMDELIITLIQQFRFWRDQAGEAIAEKQSLNGRVYLGMAASLAQVLAAYYTGVDKEQADAWMSRFQRYQARAMQKRSAALRGLHTEMS